MRERTAVALLTLGVILVAIGKYSAALIRFPYPQTTNYSFKVVPPELWMLSNNNNTATTTTTPVPKPRRPYPTAFCGNNYNPQSLPAMTWGPEVNMVDHRERLQIVGAPKGGATITAQLMLQHVGLLERAEARTDWVHNYRQKVFYKRPRHKPMKCNETCGHNHDNDDERDNPQKNRRWTCIKIVRSPLDRVVSSYIHTVHNAETRKPFKELTNVTRQHGTIPLKATFAMFVQALQLRADHGGSSFMDNHFMPQSGPCDVVPGVQHIPLEALSASLDYLRTAHGIALNATGLTSRHYVQKKAITSNNNNNNTNTTTGSQQSNEKAAAAAPSTPTVLDATRLPPPKQGKKSWPYQAYLVNQTLNAAICQLFCRDIELYAAMCVWGRAATTTTTTTKDAAAAHNSDAPWNEEMLMACQRERNGFMTSVVRHMQSCLTRMLSSLSASSATWKKRGKKQKR